MAKPVILLFKAIDGVTEPVRRMKQSLKGLDQAFLRVQQSTDKATARLKTFQQRLKTIGLSMVGVGAGMTAAITQPIVGAAGDLLRHAADWELLMAELKQRSKAGTEEFARMSDEVRKLGISSGLGFREAAKGMIDLDKAGFKGTDGTKALGAMLRTATAESISVEQAVQIGASAMAQFKKEASEAGSVMDMLSKTSDLVQISITDVGNTLRYAGVGAKAFGHELYDTLGATALLGKVGIDATVAGTDLAMLQQKFFDKTKQAKLAALGLVGKDLFQDESMQTLLPWHEMGKNIKAKGIKASQIYNVFGESSKSLLALVDNHELLAQYTLEIKNNSEGTLKALEEAKKNTYTGAVKEMKAAWESLGIELERSGALKHVTAFIKLITKAINWVIEAPLPVKMFIGTLLALAAAIGPLVTFVGSLVLGFLGLSALIGPVTIGALMLIAGKFILIGLAITALITGIGLLIYHWDDVWDFLVKKAEDGLQWIKEALNPIIDAINEMFEAFGRDFRLGRFDLTALPRQRALEEATKPGTESNLRIMRDLTPAAPADFITQRNEAALKVMIQNDTGFGTTVEQVGGSRLNNVPLSVGLNGQTLSTKKKQTAKGG